MTTRREYEKHLVKMLQQEHDNYQQRVTPLLRELEHLRARRAPTKFSVRMGSGYRPTPCVGLGRGD